MVGIPPKTIEKAHSMMDELIQQNDMVQDTTQDVSFLDMLEPIRGVKGDRNILQNLLFSSWMKPVADYFFPVEPQKSDAKPFLDFTGMEGLSRGDIEEAWSDLPTLGRFTKWKGGTGKKYVDLPTPTRLDKHTHFPIERLSEFMKLVDMYGLPDEKGKFYEPQTIMRNE